jgi:hypothetical protein
MFVCSAFSNKLDLFKATRSYTELAECYSALRIIIFSVIMFSVATLNVVAPMMLKVFDTKIVNLKRTL